MLVFWKILLMYEMNDTINFYLIHDIILAKKLKIPISFPLRKTLSGAAARGAVWENCSEKYWANSQENICLRVSFSKRFNCRSARFFEILQNTCYRTVLDNWFCQIN